MRLPSACWRAHAYLGDRGRWRNGRSGSCEVGKLPFVRLSMIGRFRVQRPRSAPPERTSMGPDGRLLLPVPQRMEDGKLRQFGNPRGHLIISVVASESDAK